MDAATSPSRKYVALGDSFSAGIGAPGEVPWPDLVESSVHNLAVEGATSDDVVTTQLPRALDLEPDLVSVVCGANDVLLELRPDIGRFARNFDHVLAALVSVDLVVCATYPEAGRYLDLRPRTRQRVTDGLQRVNKTIRALAARHGVLCLEWEGRDREADRGHYAADGLHPSPRGHRRAAEDFTRTLEGHI